MRLFVLNANAKDIQELLAVARTCEAARSADTPQTSNIDNLTDMVGSLIAKVSQLTTATAEQNIKGVKFTEAAMSSENSDRQINESVQQPPSGRDYQRQYRPSYNQQQSSFQSDSQRNQYGASTYQRTRHPMVTRTTGNQPAPGWQQPPDRWRTPSPVPSRQWTIGQWN